MKSVMISVQPQWCEKIKNIVGQKGTKPIYEKSVEIRKTRPKIDTPFKCYIYETKALYKPSGSNHLFNGEGKVIGEFVCNRIQEYESEFVDDDCFEMIASIDRDEEGDATGFYEWTNDSDIPYTNTDFFKKCCVGYADLKKYMGEGFSTFYGWHISDLVIYKKPKELSEFYTVCKMNCEYCEMWGSVRVNAEEFDMDCKSDWFNHKPLKRPPQSWCYIDHPTEKGGVE